MLGSGQNIRISTCTVIWHSYSCAAPVFLHPIRWGILVGGVGVTPNCLLLGSAPEINLASAWEDSLNRCKAPKPQGPPSEARAQDKASQYAMTT